MGAGALAGLGIGGWMSHDHEAFRWYLPLIATLQGGGLLLMVYLSRRSIHTRELAAADTRSFYNRVVEPITHMKEVLKNDRVFAQYETAYMIYGIGWMICYALLPLLITDKLKLPYDQATGSTQVPYQIVLGLAFAPAGLMMDKLGAIRSTGISFLLLTLYPIGLIFAASSFDLTMVSAFYGLAHAGASVGWVLGPVALAPSKDKVPQYVAIHATMVGSRGKLFLGLGVLLYSLTHCFTWPLVVGAAGFLFSSYIMLKLHGKVRGTNSGGAAPIVPTAATTPAPAPAPARS